MPTLTWTGKDVVVEHHLKVPLHVIRILELPQKSTGNLLLQGDNLIALRALLPHYRGTVSCVYIDPPYNTGNEKWAYNDRVDHPEIRRWLGQLVKAGKEDLCRHDKWACMMYPRLRLIRELMSDKGVIFMSIDDHELASLLFIADEIFARENLLGIFTWKRKDKGSHLDDHVRKMTEYVVCFARDRRSRTCLFGETAYPAKLQPLVKRTNANNVLVFPPGSVTSQLKDGAYQPGKRHPGKSPGDEGTAIVYLKSFDIEKGRVTSELHCKARFVWQQRFLDEEVRLGTTIELSRKFGLNAARHDQSKKTKTPTTLLTSDIGIGTNEDASFELSSIFGRERGKVFPFPKPVSLVKYLVRSATHGDKSAIILDSFAGSGTTGQAVHELNAEDGGNRRWILVELDSDISNKVTKIRLGRTAGEFFYAGLGDPLVAPAESRPGKSRATYEAIASLAFLHAVGLPWNPQDRDGHKLGSHDGTTVFLFYDDHGRTAMRSELSPDILSALQSMPGVKCVYADECKVAHRPLKQAKVIFRPIASLYQQ